MILSIVIVNYKYKGSIKEMLKYFKKNPLSTSFEIHVVDNNSKDGIKSMLKKDFPDVLFHPLQKNIGFGKANNIALEKVKGEFVLLLNPDIITTSASIETLLSFMQKNKHVGIAAPRLVNPDSSIQHTCYRFPTFFTPIYRRTFLGKTKKGKKDRMRYLMLDKSHSLTEPVDWVQGSAMIIRKSHLNKVGMFDKRFFMYMEDVDLCRRFWEQNFPVYYVAESEMVHYHKRASAEDAGVKILFNTLLRNHIASFLRYMFKYKNKKLPKIIDKVGVVK